MGWTSSPPAFSAATETAADIANADIKSNVPVPIHPLSTLAATMDDPTPMPASTTNGTSSPNNQPSPAAQMPASTTIGTPSPKNQPSPAAQIYRCANLQYTAVPTVRDPSLPYSKKLAAYIDIFVDDFIGLSHGIHNRQRVRNILLRAVDQIFRPNDFYNDEFRREPVALKK